MGVTPVMRRYRLTYYERVLLIGILTLVMTAALHFAGVIRLT